MSVGVVIQARINSTRLPGKVLAPINGLPLLAHPIRRLAMLKWPVQTVVATSTNRCDDAIEAYCQGQPTTCFRGSESDVLARFVACSRQFGFEHIVRLTADNPFPDIAELDRLIELHVGEAYDFTHSFDQMPIGCGAEIFTLEALERSDRLGTAAHHREHVDEYVLENPTVFRIGRLSIPVIKCRPDLRLTVDTAEDLRRAQFVAERSSNPWVSTEEAITLCSQFA